MSAVGDRRTDGIAAHPFVANGQRQAEEELGGHLSPWNLKFRTRRNFSVLCGYTTCSTKHGDGKPRHAEQMAHLWMKLSQANKGPGTSISWARFVSRALDLLRLETRAAWILVRNVRGNASRTLAQVRSQS